MNGESAVPMFHKIRRIHMVGIGGSGMSGIAEVLHSLGFAVTGSDRLLSPVTARLESIGIPVAEGHDAANVRGAQVVVYSSAVKADNPELLAAQAGKIPVIERSEMLGELTRMRFTIGIAGTHGKTTTTSMVGQLLTHAGMAPTIIVGGITKSLGSGGILGKGGYFVVEADEYARTFLRMFPTIGVITTLEADHLDCYRDFGEIESAFKAYLERLPFFGVAILGIDDPNVRALVPSIRRRVVTYGFAGDADVRAIDVRSWEKGSRFSVVANGENLGEVALAVPGRHNVQNALAAIVVARDLGVSVQQIREGLAGFSGVDRRFQVRGKVHGATIIDDFAHHPTAVRVTLDTARSMAGEGARLLVAFQPHLFSRTRDMYEEFGAALARAELVLVLDIYPSRETPIEGVTSRLVAEACSRAGARDVREVHSHEEAAAILRDSARSGDIVLTIGAGDIWKVGTALAETEENS
ncbi:MAG TPA: UDP-N-acetylmuramate--L-alanine ligase [Candidatus Latescibacteria bacterium]|nr:UDP-N-acetylmuramate--L-alanine ligase [Candidatus Latescibacterota bacterium]